MQFFKPEFLRIKDSNYLVIHKNGSRSVVENFKPEVKPYVDRYRTWAIIRDPMDRFISGLAYDIKRVGVVLKEELIKHPEKCLFSLHKANEMNRGFGSHTIMQSTYFMNAKIDTFVKIEDLSKFIEVHNGEYKPLRENKTLEEEKEIAKELVNKMDQQRLNDLFYVEKRIYNNIINSSMIWSWQNGKIFDYGANEI